MKPKTDFPLVVIIAPQYLHFTFSFDPFYFCLRSEEVKGQCVVETDMMADTDGDGLSSECNSNTEGSQPGNSSRNTFLVTFCTNLMTRTDFLSLDLFFFFFFSPQTASFWRKEALKGGQMLLRHWRR